MSTTQIHFQARLSPARRDELAALRAGRAETEAARRAEAEAAERVRLVEEGRTQLRQIGSQIHAQLQTYGDAADAELRALGAAVKATIGEAKAATDLATLCALETQLSRQAQQAVALLLQKSAPPAKEASPTEADALRALALQLAAIDPALRERFDEGGDEPARQALAQARRTGEAEDVARAAAEVEAHRARIDQRYQAWEQARAAALLAQAQLVPRLSGLHADEVVVTWCAAKLQAAAAICDRIAHMIGEERWEEAAAIARSAGPLCDTILARAQERQLREEERASLVAGLLEGLRQQELTVLDPELAQSGDLESAVVLHVRRLGRPLTVTIHSDARVSYQSAAEDPTLWLVAHKAHHTLTDAYGFELTPVTPGT